MTIPDDVVKSTKEFAAVVLVTAILCCLGWVIGTSSYNHGWLEHEREVFTKACTAKGGEVKRFDRGLICWDKDGRREIP